MEQLKRYTVHSMYSVMNDVCFSVWQLLCCRLLVSNVPD